MSAADWFKMSAPSKFVGEMQRPVSEGGLDLAALEKVQVPVVLDGAHAGPDDVFRDEQALWGPRATGHKP